MTQSEGGARSIQSIHAVYANRNAQMTLGTLIATLSGSGHAREKKRESIIWPTPRHDVKRVM